MGRALFSQRYRSEPAVCEGPVPPLAVPCQRWGPCNQFDPDSEEFFKNAQLEQFLDGLFDGSVWTLEHSSPRDLPHAAVLDNASDTASSPTTVSSNDNDESLSDSNDSPMALGTHPEDSLTFHQTSPAPDFIVSAPYRASSTSTPVSTAQMHPGAQQAAGSPRSPLVPRTVSITPINIPTQPSLPAPASPPTPASPSPPATSATYPDNTTNLIAPFRLRNALPGFHMWDHRLELS